MAQTDFSHRDDVRKFVSQLSVENLKAREVVLHQDEFAELDVALCAMEVHGHRGQEE